MNIKYRVTLTDSERQELKGLIARGKTQGYRIRHAQIMLAVDDIPGNKEWTDKKIAKAYSTSERSVGNLRRRFVENGFAAALERQKRENPPKIKIDGETEAKIIALTCSGAPEGHSQWSLRLLADKVVELGIMDSISHTAIADCLKKTRLSHGYKSSGVFQSPPPSL
jgi:predicted hydrolase (HD superfamily)